MRAGSEGPVSLEGREHKIKIMTTMEKIGEARPRFKMGGSQKASLR